MSASRFASGSRAVTTCSLQQVGASEAEEMYDATQVSSQDNAMSEAEAEAELEEMLQQIEEAPSHVAQKQLLRAALRETGAREPVTAKPQVKTPGSALAAAEAIRAAARQRALDEQRSRGTSVA